MNSLTRWSVVAAVLAAAMLGAVSWVGLSGPPGLDAGAVRTREPSVAATPSAAGQSAATRSAAPLAALEVLSQWDRRRAATYASGDAATLRRLYAAGSGAGEADVAILRGYVGRGLRVVDMRMQMLSVSVLARSVDSLRLRVTDRLVGAEAVGRRTRFVLPRDQASTRVVTLVRVDGTWRVLSVS